MATDVGQGEPLRVLHVEDDPFVSRVMREALMRSKGLQCTVQNAGTLAAGLACLAASPMDVLLLDLSLPDCQGLNTVAAVRGQFSSVPIVVFSGHDDEALALAALKLGAQDYLVKGTTDPQVVLRAIRYAIERKRTDDELAYERDLLHSLLDNIPDRIYFKNAASQFLRVNRAMAHKFGLTDPGHAIGKSDFDFHPAPAAREFFTDEQRLLKTREPIVNKVERQINGDGSASWASVTKVPMWDRHGSVTGIIGISRDISAFKQLESSLEKERSLLRSLVDHLPDYIYVLDEAGRFILTNESFTQLARTATSTPLLGRTAQDLFPAPLGRELHEDDLLVLRTGQPVRNRTDPCRLGDDPDCWLSTTKVPLRDAGGETIGLVVISHDVTAQRRASRELQTAIAELQKANAALRDTQIQLMHADRLQSVGRLAAGVAHEVKNPLAVLRMGVDYFANTELPPETAGSAWMVIEDMESAIKRADTIIMGLLNYSAPHELELAAVEVDELLDRACGMVRHEINTHGYLLERQRARCRACALLDGQKIEQVLVNLITNAFHATPDGGRITLRTLLRTITDDEDHREAGSRQAAHFRTGDEVIEIQLDDSGSGIPPDKLDKIFDPFFTTKETGKGTGLGLTVARKIVELHEGTLTIDNRPEGGVRCALLFKATKEPT